VNLTHETSTMSATERGGPPIARLHALAPSAPTPAEAAPQDENTTIDGLEAQLEKLIALVGHLRVALESRDVIGQAKGIIMASTGCNADEAFALLVAQSQAENRKVIAIATSLVARRSGSPKPLNPPT
jgi:hypothetical protein